MSNKNNVDHEIKVLVTSDTYLAVKHVADADERPMSSWVRHLIKTELRKLSAIAADEDRTGSGRDRED
jgi:hypothetical protein